jgi:hypothetical protein
VIFCDVLRPGVETISRIGYGQMSPATLYGNIVMTVDAMFGLIPDVAVLPMGVIRFLSLSGKPGRSGRKSCCNLSQ